jgi:hypothetical protein
MRNEIGTAPHTPPTTAGAARTPRECASVQKVGAGERTVGWAIDRNAMRPSHLKQDTMSLSDSVAAPAEVFYVVQSTGARGRREHRLASVLYEMRAHAHTELARLIAAHPGDYAVWKSATYIEPPQWGYAVMRADGTVVPAGAVGSQCGPLPHGLGPNGGPPNRSDADRSDGRDDRSVGAAHVRTSVAEQVACQSWPRQSSRYMC